MAVFENYEFPAVQCDYFALPSVTCKRFCNSYMHLNIRSLFNKIAEIEVLLNLFGHPKVLMLSETWLALNSVLLEISDYAFISFPRLTSRGGGVGIYIHTSLLIMLLNISLVI